MLGIGFFVVAIALLIASVATRWGDVREALALLRPRTVMLSFVLALAGLIPQMLSWRSLLDGTGYAPPFPATSRIYFVGQIGKYVPGGAWSVLAQAQLARRHQISRTRSAVIALSTLTVIVTTGALFAALGLVGWSPDSLSRYWWVLAVVPLRAALLYPPVFNRALALVEHLLRRPVEDVQIERRTLASSAGWSCVMWVLFGLHAATLVAGLHPASPLRAGVLAVGAFALAWVVGFLVVIAPAGTGPREAALVLALAPALPSSSALLVALVSRVLMVVADAVAAGVAAVIARHTSDAPAQVSP